MIGFARNLYKLTGTALVGNTTNSEMPRKDQLVEISRFA